MRTFREFKTDIIADLEYRKKYYHPEFKASTPIFQALFAWCMTMTLFFSLALRENYIFSWNEQSTITAWGLVAVVWAVMAVFITTALTKDILNILMCGAECVAVFMGYWVATRIPVSDGEVGSLFYTTLLGFTLSFFFGLGVNGAGRTLLKK